MERAAIIPRPEAVKWMQRWRDRDVIKVVTGLRRCGKSTVLRLAQRTFMHLHGGWSIRDLYHCARP